jgi:tetratricopeptide (TPR) repeat protein
LAAWPRSDYWRLPRQRWRTCNGRCSSVAASNATTQLNAFAPEESIRGCSDLISMRSITGNGRAQAYKLRGDRYRELHDWDHALADYSQVIRMRGDHPGAYYRRSEVYLGAGRI